MLTLDLMRYEHYNIHTSDKNRYDGTFKKQEIGIKRERNDKYENCFMEDRQTFLINFLTFFLLDFFLIWGFFHECLRCKIFEKLKTESFCLSFYSEVK